MDTAATDAFLAHSLQCPSSPDGAAVAAGCRRFLHFVHISLVIVIGQSEIMYSVTVINHIVEFVKRLKSSKLMHVWSAIVIRGPVKAQSAC